MYGILVLIIIVLVVFYRFKLPNIKGAIGESRVARQLRKLKDERYKVFSDVLIKTSRGSSQIDHVVISIFGIFVIESKNYRGWIHGSENSEYWTQTIYSSKSKLRNPIRQNLSHIYALKEVLSEFGHLTYHPIVVFAGSATLKNVSSKTPVVYVNKLFQTIMATRDIPNLDIEKVNKIADKLRVANIQDKPTRKLHNLQVREHIKDRKQKERSLICPRCGGNLIGRVGKYGKFYGCSNYPRCKYKQSD